MPGVTAAAIGWLVGIVALQLSPGLPGAHGLAGLAVGAIALLAAAGLCRGRPRACLLVLSAMVAGHAWAGLLASGRLGEALPVEWERRDIEVVGVVAEMPQPVARGTRFVFHVESVLTPGAIVPRRVLLGWYRGGGPAGARSGAPAAGERWQLRIRLRRPHGAVNPHGFDVESWLLERGLRAVGHVQRAGVRLDERAAGFGYAIERTREAIRSRLLAALEGQRYAGVVLALAIGDSAAIPAGQWAAFARAGITHLLSISGLHVTLLAGLAGLLVDRLWRSQPRCVARCPARRVAAATALLVATGYALLAGFGVPARRTVCMLAVVAIAVWRAGPVRPGALLARAAAAVTLMDPWSVLSVGFWLSFGGVGVLMLSARAARPAEATGVAPSRGPVTRRLGRIGRAVIDWIRIQIRISVALVPPSLAFFQQVPLLGPVANALAIPVVGTLAVPAAVAAALLPVPGLPALAHLLVDAGLSPVEWLAAREGAVWTRAAPPPWTVALALAGTLWWLMPPGWPLRRAALVALLPLVLVGGPRPLPPGAIELVVADVGQGLAVLVRTAEGSVLYDSGPAWGASDAGSRILVPLLRAHGIRGIELLVISHEDSDHSGGAASVLQEVPVGGLLSSLREGHPLAVMAGHATRCHAGQRWSMGGARFEVLHPHWDSYARALTDNDRSCVLAIEASGTRVLLTGDASERSEAAMEARGEDLRAHVLVVAHHGAGGSTSAGFLAAVAPRLALISVGYRNRFGHPHPDVIERLSASGARVLRTDRDGALLLGIDAGGVQVRAWREASRRYWRERPSSAQPDRPAGSSATER